MIPLGNMEFVTDLYDLNFRGRLPLFISDFLSNRHFKVKMNSTISDSFTQETGVPQGSILSPVLFNIKINNIVKSVIGNANTSLFVDDFAIYIEGKHLPYLERSMQLCINRVQKWVSQNGFKFSDTKTICVHFHKQRNLHAEPSISLNNIPIKVKREATFLGITFDQKLSFAPHIKSLKNKCLRALNILRVLGHTDWGADKEILLKLYRTLVRSKLDYGSIIYGSAPKYILKMLDPIHHQGLRIALGAFRTSPVKSLYVEAKEPSLSHQRLKLSMNYFLKLKSLPENPAYDCVFNTSSSEIFEKSKTCPPFGQRILPHIISANTNFKEIHDRGVSTPPPWRTPTININFELCKFRKDITNPIIYRQEFLEIRARYLNCFDIYTDGSKQNEKVGAAFFSPKNQGAAKMRLKDNSSIFSAELVGIILSLNQIKFLKSKYHYRNFIVMTDSLSALQGLRDRQSRNIYVNEIFKLLNSLKSQVIIHFMWIPGHVGINGNEKADQLAKSALDEVVDESIPLTFSDLRPLTNNYLDILWQEEWNGELDNKLHEIDPILKDSMTTITGNRRQETVLSRLRIGHSWLTHRRPSCLSCM
jgi:ribonuclease HI